MALTVVIDPHLFDIDYLSVDSNRVQLELALHAFWTAPNCTFAATRNLRDSYRERKGFLRAIEQRKVKRIMTVLEDRLLKPRPVPLERTGGERPHQGCGDLEELGNRDLANILLAAEPTCPFASDPSVLRRVTPGSLPESGLLDELGRSNIFYLVDGNLPTAVDKLQNIIEELVTGNTWNTFNDPYLALPRGRDGEWETSQGWNWELSLDWILDRVRSANKSKDFTPTVTFISKSLGPGSEPFDHEAWIRSFSDYCQQQAGVDVRFLLNLVGRTSDDAAHARFLITEKRSFQVDQGWQLIQRQIPYNRRHARYFEVTKSGMGAHADTTVICLKEKWLKTYERAIAIEEKPAALAMGTLRIDLNKTKNTSFAWVTASGVKKLASMAEVRDHIIEDRKVMSPQFASAIFKELSKPRKRSQLGEPKQLTASNPPQLDASVKATQGTNLAPSEARFRQLRPVGRPAGNRSRG